MNNYHGVKAPAGKFGLWYQHLWKCHGITTAVKVKTNYTEQPKVRLIIIAPLFVYCQPAFTIFGTYTLYESNNWRLYSCLTILRMWELLNNVQLGQKYNYINYITLFLDTMKIFKFFQVNSNILELQILCMQGFGRNKSKPAAFFAHFNLQFSRLTYQP